MAECLVENQIICDEQKEEYTYGLEVFGLKMVNYGTIMILAMLMNRIISTVFFLVSYVGLRGRTGGYHTRSAKHCYFGTVSIYMGIIFVAEKVFIKHFGILLILWVISVVCILSFAPVNNENLQLSKDEMRMCRKRSCLYVTGCLLIVCVFKLVGMNLVYIVYFLLGIILDASLLLIEVMTERRGSE